MTWGIPAAIFAALVAGFSHWQVVIYIGCYLVGYFTGSWGRTHGK